MTHPHPNLRAVGDDEVGDRRHQVRRVLETARLACELGLAGDIDLEEAAESAAGVLAMLDVDGAQRIADLWTNEGGESLVARMVASGALTATITGDNGDTVPVALNLPEPEGITRLRTRGR